VLAHGLLLISPAAFFIMPCAEELPLFASHRSLHIAGAGASVSSTYHAPRHVPQYATARAVLLVVAVVGLCCIAAVSHRSASLRISVLEQTDVATKTVSSSAPPAQHSEHASLSVEQQIAEGNKEMKELEAKVAQVRKQQNAVQLKSHNVLVDKAHRERLAAAPQTDSYLKSIDHRTSAAVAATSDAVTTALTADQSAAKKALKAAILAEKFKLRAQQKEKHDMEIVQRAREREIEDQKEERKAEVARKVADRVAAVQRAKAAKDVANRMKSIVDADIARTRKDKAEEEHAERAAEAAQHTADMLSATDKNVVRAHSKAQLHQPHHLASARHKPVDSNDAPHSDRRSHTIVAARTKQCDPLSGWAETLC
jgi:hypothetical protein